MKWLPKLLPLRSALSDEQAMREVQVRGDHAAFTRLVERWEAPIRRLCIRMTGNEHRGEDLAQETFYRVFARRHQFKPSGKFSTWLWRIALNLCFEEGRRAGRRGDVRLLEDADDSATTEVAPDSRLIDAERAELVRKALLAIQESHRVVVVLREYEGMKYREIAEVLEVPEGTVKWRMAEALAQLSEQLKPLFQDECEPAPEAQVPKKR